MALLLGWKVLPCAEELDRGFKLETASALFNLKDEREGCGYESLGV